MAAPRGVRFREVQRLRQWWAYLLVGLSALPAWWAWWVQIVEGEPFGTEPAPDLVVWALWLVVGVTLPAGLVSLRLITEVRGREVRVRFRPFPSRDIDVNAILAAAPVTVKPVSQWGGFGYRRNLQGDVAFLMHGRTAVRLSLGADETLVIGSQRPEELVAAIEESRRG